MAFSPGDVVDRRFRLDAPLGRGGSGDAWRATDLQLQRAVALKRLGDEAASDSTGRDDSSRRRRLREARALAKLRHENVVGVYDVIESAVDAAGADAGATSWLVLELVDGKTLRAVLDERLLTLDEVRALGRGLAHALLVTHRQGIVHGDLKPENVLLRGGIVDDDSVVVVDFGLAAPSPVDASGATPACFAPERVEGGRVDDGAADRYALGVVVYEAVAGANPFAAATVAQTLARHVELSPPPPSRGRAAGAVPAVVDDVILALLSRDPAARPSCEQILAALSGARAEPQTVPSSSASSAASSSSSSSSAPLRAELPPSVIDPGPRRPGIVIAAVAVAVVIAIVLAFVAPGFVTSPAATAPRAPAKP